MALVRLTYRKYPWVPAVWLLLTIVSGLILVFEHPTSVLGWIGLVLGQNSVSLLYWDAKSMSNHWRTQLEHEISTEIGKALHEANKDLLRVDLGADKLKKAAQDLSGE